MRKASVRKPSVRVAVSGTWQRVLAHLRRGSYYGCCSLCSHDWRGHHHEHGCIDCAGDQHTGPVQDLPALCQQLAPGWTIWSTSPSGCPTGHETSPA